MYVTNAYIVSFVHLNETVHCVFASRVKAALFIARHERNLQAWRVQVKRVDAPGFSRPYTLEARTLVDKLQLKLDLRGTDNAYTTYSVVDDPLLQDARRVLKNN